jgi:asparagine synthase (glutamine-hydrolysing)
MCLWSKTKAEALRPQVLEMSKIIIAGRTGGIFSNEKAIMSHERLAIVDPSS